MHTQLTGLQFALFSVLMAFVALPGARGETYSVTSPDGHVRVQVDVNRQIRYSVQYDGGSVIESSPIALTVNNSTVLGHNPSVTKTDQSSVRETITPVVARKEQTIPDEYNRLRITFRKNFTVTFRAYDDGVAYRFATTYPGNVKVQSEQASFRFAEDYPVYFPVTESFITHQEANYRYGDLSTVTLDSLGFPPVLIAPEQGPKILITEADLEDYPGMYLTRDQDDPLMLVGTFPAYPLQEQQQGDRTVIVSQRADYLAQTAGTRAFPWRVIAIAPHDTDLLQNEIVYRLAKPLQLEDTSWIHPGKVAWDWWNALNVYGVDFKSGVNTATYKYYIDFAARYHLDYVILDEGWSEPSDLFAINPDVDMEELTSYAEQKDVGLILWCVWLSLDNDLQRALDQFQQWGIKGIKVDFMQRDDQKMVNYYRTVTREAAKRHLLVDFHGAYKPAGLRRAYPNLITREGVQGLEHSKWSRQPDPEYTLQLPFIRMFAGPMDFTPGAMHNAQKANFRPIFNRPMSLGTRVHQLAMYVVYESPLQMLSDSPTHYMEQPEMMEFLSRVPTTWDETRPLDARVSDYLVLARRSGDQWYVGAMTDWTPRDLTVDLGFLPAGSYTARIYQDGINADRYASDYVARTIRVPADRQLQVQLAPGGGWVARIFPAK